MNRHTTVLNAVRWLTMVSKLYMLSHFFITGITADINYSFLGLVCSALSTYGKKHVLLTISMPVVISNVHIAHGQSNSCCR